MDPDIEAQAGDERYFSNNTCHHISSSPSSIMCFVSSFFLQRVLSEICLGAINLHLQPAGSRPPSTLYVFISTYLRSVFFYFLIFAALSLRYPTVSSITPPPSISPSIFLESMFSTQPYSSSSLIFLRQSIRKRLTNTRL